MLIKTDWQVAEAWKNILCRIGDFEGAERRLNHAFRVPPSKAVQASVIDPSDADLADSIIARLKKTSVIDIDGLEQCVRTRKAMLAQENNASLDATGFLQVHLSTYYQTWHGNFSRNSEVKSCSANNCLWRYQSDLFLFMPRWYPKI